VALDKGTTPDRRLVLVATILGSTIVFVDSTVVNVALPAIGRDLDATLAGQQWVMESYLLLMGSLVLLGGSLGDIYGRRTIFALGIGGFGLTSMICAIAPSTETLVAARGLQGIAGALLVPSSLAIITAVFHDPVERGAAIGSWTAWTSAAVAAGPPLGGFIVDTFDWRFIFAINVPIVATTLWLTLRHVPDLRPDPDCPRHVDVVGAALCAAGLGGIVLALIEQPSHGWGDPLVAVPLIAGAVLLAAFVAFERHATAPMLPHGLFANRDFTVTNAATLTVYAGLSGALFFVALFLQQVGGYDATEGGLALTPITLVLIAFSRHWGALAERIGPRLLMTAGPSLMAAGLLLFTRVDADADYVAQVLPATLVFGLGLSMTVAPLTATVLGAVEEHRAGIASGVNNAVARIAGLLAIAVVGAVVAGRLGASTFSDAPARDAVEAFHAGMYLGAALLVAGALTSLFGLSRRARCRPRLAQSPL
jgi:EmrB/QacA subfamily drug resistance transporter